jgi:hypothetical protein
MARQTMELLLALAIRSFDGPFPNSRSRLDSGAEDFSDPQFATHSVDIEVRTGGQEDHTVARAQVPVQLLGNRGLKLGPNPFLAKAAGVFGNHIDRLAAKNRNKYFLLGSMIGEQASTVQPNPKRERHQRSELAAISRVPGDER